MIDNIIEGEELDNKHTELWNITGGKKPLSYVILEYHTLLRTRQQLGDTPAEAQRYTLAVMESNYKSLYTHPQTSNGE